MPRSPQDSSYRGSRWAHPIHFRCCRHRWIRPKNHHVWLPTLRWAPRIHSRCCRHRWIRGTGCAPSLLGAHPFHSCAFQKKPSIDRAGRGDAFVTDYSSASKHHQRRGAVAGRGHFSASQFHVKAQSVDLRETANGHKGICSNHRGDQSTDFEGLSEWPQRGHH